MFCLGWGLSRIVGMRPKSAALLLQREILHECQRVKEQIHLLQTSPVAQGQPKSFGTRPLRFSSRVLLIWLQLLPHHPKPVHRGSSGCKLPLVNPVAILVLCVSRQVGRHFLFQFDDVVYHLPNMFVFIVIATGHCVPNRSPVS